jgi:hypothetical protein
MLSKTQIELLNKQKQIELLKKREERYMFYGIYEEYLQAKTVVQVIDYTKLNPYQHFLFKRVLHGLNMYSKDQVKKMHRDKKRRIIKVWKRGQAVLNKWKQIISNKKINYYLYKTFGENAKAFLEIPETDYLPDYKCKASLKDLGIRYEDVILMFIQEKLLPRNFFELKNEYKKGIK